MKTSLLLFSLLTVAFLSYAKANDQALDQEPTPFSSYLQNEFSHYVKETRQWLETNRVFRSDDRELELSVNAPFELKPAKPNGKGVLLVHGLSDSPYSFVDVGRHLEQQGFVVRTVLLPGHGGKPADLMLPTIEDWLALVHHHTELLAEQVDEVWLGGFSTGANLALVEAYENKRVAGTLLFSPAIDSTKPLDFMAPIAKHFMDWADIDPEMSITRFDSLTMNGAALYYESAELARDKIKQAPYDKPVLMTLSEQDSVVNNQAVLSYFKERFTHPDKQLVWFGEQDFNHEKVKRFSMDLPTQRIRSGSHMSVLYVPDNPLYGENGSIRICNNGQTEDKETACNEGAETWFSAFDHTESDKIFARLTWNPYFQQTIDTMLDVLN